jgi:Methyltransferase domain
MAILNNGFFRSGFYARAYRKLMHSIYVNDLWLDLRLHAKREAVDYVIANMPEAMVLPDRERLLQFALSRAPEQGFVAEFGVAKGDSLRNLASRTRRQVHGFDSFGGLPEDWGGTKETTGAFTNKGKLPKVPANVTLHVGWFDETLPRFLASTNEPAAFLHMDADIYSSTKTVLQALRERIVSGTVILFDEYFNYPGWRGHEYKAFQEFIAETGLSYKYFGLSAEKGHVAAVIL